MFVKSWLKRKSAIIEFPQHMSLDMTRYKALKVAYALLEVGVCTLTVEVYFCRVEVDPRRRSSILIRVSAALVSCHYNFDLYHITHFIETKDGKGKREGALLHIGVSYFRNSRYSPC